MTKQTKIKKQEKLMPSKKLPSTMPSKTAEHDAEQNCRPRCRAKKLPNTMPSRSAKHDVEQMQKLLFWHQNQKTWGRSDLWGEHGHTSADWHGLADPQRVHENPV